MEAFEILDDTISSRQQGVRVAIGGWLLLIAGLAILRLDVLPSQLKSFDDWLQPLVSRLYVNAPMPPGLWLPGILFLLTGMILVGYAGINLVDALHLSFPNLRMCTAMSGPSLAPRWLVLVLVSNLAWIGVVIAAARGPTHWSIIPLWVMAIVLQGVCWWRAGHSEHVDLHVSVRWVQVVGIVVAVGIVIYRLGDVPNSIWGDEGAFWGMARDLAAGTRANPFALGVYGAYPLMSSFYQSFWLRIFGSTLWSWRFSSAVIGVLTIVPLFLLVRRLLGARVAWSAVVLMIGTPYFLAFTRMGYNNIQPLFPVTMGLWLIVEALVSQSRGLAYLAGVTLGMASLTYTAGHTGLLLAILFLLFLFLSTKVIPLRRSIVELGFCLGIGWLYAAGPCFLGAALRGDLLGGKGTESFFGSAFYGEALFSIDELTRLYPLQQVGQHTIFFEPRLYALLFVRGVLRTGLGMLVDEVAVQHYLVGPLAGPGVVFFLAGFAWALRRFRQRQATLWAIWILVCTLLLSALNTFPPRATHLVPIIPAVATLTAVGIWLLNGLLRRVLRPLWADSLAVVLTIVLALIGLDAYFVRMPKRYLPDLQNLMFWRAQEMGEGSHVVFIVDAPYPSDFQVRDIDEFRLGVEHRSVPADRLRTTDFRALCGGLDTQQGVTCRVFFLAGVKADRIKAELWRQLGEGTIRTHTDAHGRTIGLEFVPENSVVHPGTGPWRSGLFWNGALVSSVLIAIALSPLPVQAIAVNLIFQASTGIIAVKRKITSAQTRWAHRIGPSLFFGCVICGILGQAYFARDSLSNRTEIGTNFWPGAVFYGFSIVYLLQLTRTANLTLWEGILSLPSSSQPLSRMWARDRNDRVVEWWRFHASELATVLILMSVAFVLRVFAIDSAGQTVGGLSVKGALIGTASVMVTYVLAREILGRRAAVVSGFFLAAQHHHLHVSRLGSSSAFDTLSAPLLVFLLLRGFQSHRRGWFVAAAGLTLGLALYSRWGAIVLPTLMLAVAAIAGGLRLMRRTMSQANLVNLGILVLGAAFALVPIAFSEMGLPGGYLGQLSKVAVFRSGSLADTMQQPWKSALGILGSSLLRSSLAFNYFVDQSSWYGPSIPMLDPVSGVLFVMGLTMAARFILRNVGYLLVVVWIGVAVVVSSLLTVSPAVSESLVITTPALSLIIALGLMLLAEYGMVLGGHFALASRHLPFVVTLVLMLVNVGCYFWGGICSPDTQLCWGHPQISPQL